jgi:hypothetical protein
MRDGQEFSKVKPHYKTIKELEWHLKVLEWEEASNSHSERGAPYSEGRPYL